MGWAIFWLLGSGRISLLRFRKLFKKYLAQILLGSLFIVGQIYIQVRSGHRPSPYLPHDLIENSKIVVLEACGPELC